MYDEEIKANCRGCEKESDFVRPIQYHMWARNDAYGIYTGLYCEKCYDTPPNNLMGNGFFLQSYDIDEYTHEWEVIKDYR